MRLTASHICYQVHKLILSKTVKSFVCRDLLVLYMRPLSAIISERESRKTVVSSRSDDYSVTVVIQPVMTLHSTKSMSSTKLESKAQFLRDLQVPLYLFGPVYK